MELLQGKSGMSEVSADEIGGYSEKVTPVPIPNTVVKLLRADNTERVTAWENMSSPVLFFREQVFAL